MGQAQLAGNNGSVPRTKLRLPCRIFRPAAAAHQMDATDFSFNNFQALLRRQSSFSGPPFYTNDWMRNLRSR